MNDNDANPIGRIGRRPPWNKGKLIGAKPPLRPSHVWSIRTKLHIEHRTRDWRFFNLAIDSKLRGCDVVAVQVSMTSRRTGYTLDRAPCARRKPGTQSGSRTRQPVDEYLRQTGRQPGQFLFAAVSLIAA